MTWAAGSSDADQFHSRMRDAILRDAKGCAKRTGIPELGYLQMLDRPKPSQRFIPIGSMPVSIGCCRTKRPSRNISSGGWLSGGAQMQPLGGV